MLNIKMIKNFRHRGLKRLYEKGDKSKVHSQQADKIKRILTALDIADSPQDMNLPGYKFHTLHGDLKGYYSVWVTGNWRIVFKFDDVPEDVDLTDYH